MCAGTRGMRAPCTIMPASSRGGHSPSGFWTDSRLRCCTWSLNGGSITCPKLVQRQTAGNKVRKDLRIKAPRHKTLRTRTHKAINYKTCNNKHKAKHRNLPHSRSQPNLKARRNPHKITAREDLRQL